MSQKRKHNIHTHRLWFRMHSMHTKWYSCGARASRGRSQLYATTTHWHHFHPKLWQPLQIDKIHLSLGWIHSGLSLCHRWIYALSQNCVQLLWRTKHIQKLENPMAEDQEIETCTLTTLICSMHACTKRAQSESHHITGTHNGTHKIHKLYNYYW